MSDALSIAVSGLNAAVTRATHSANNIVNDTSTDKNVDADLVDIKIASVDYAVNATVIKTQHKLDKALLDILA